MIYDNHSDTIVEGNIRGDRVNMGIERDAMAHVMRVLTDLYERPREAVLREYVTNALDSHAEAGTVRPVEVTLPSLFSPILYIEDFGVGLSVEDIHRIYSQYGASTKRETNEQTGTLGLGSKSALTYTSQFTLTSVKDGSRIGVMVSRDDEGGGQMTVLDTSATDRPNGTRIAIPVQRGDSFRVEAARLFKFLPKGDVLVNGEVPNHIGDAEGVVKLRGDLWLVPAAALDQHYVVMGHVAYPMPGDAIPGGYRLLSWATMGGVHFVPSRERLHLTAKTRAYVDQAWADNVTLRIRRAVRALAKAPTGWAALEAAKEWRKVLPNNEWHRLTWHGKTIPDRFTVGAELAWGHGDRERQEGEETTWPWHVNLSESYGPRAPVRIRNISADRLHTTVHVTGFTLRRVVKGHREKLKVLLGDRAGDSQGALLWHGDIPEDLRPWVDPANVVTYGDLRKVKLEGTAARPKGTFDLWHKDLFYEGVDLATFAHCPVFYENGNRAQTRGVAKALGERFPRAILVPLPANRVEKFKRDHPTARPAGAGRREARDALLKGVTADERAALDMQDKGLRLRLRGLDLGKIRDPELREAVRLSRLDIAALAERMRAFGVTMAEDTERSNPLDNYPLITQYWGYDDHTYWYINAAYTARKEGDLT